MKISIATLLFLFLFIQISSAETYFYIVEKNDQLGMLLLSLGHTNLWSKSGKVYLYESKNPKRNLATLIPDSKLFFSDSDVLLEENVEIHNKQIFLKQKIRRMSDYVKMPRNEEKKITESKTVATHSEKNIGRTSFFTSHSLRFFAGGGAFFFYHQEVDRQTSTKTLAFLQPLVKFNLTYSNQTIGAMSVDFALKKVFQNAFEFPINRNFNFQYRPNFNFSDSFRLALSYSSLDESFIGKFSNKEIQYKLDSNLIGVGLIFPRDLNELSVTFEKVLSGHAVSKESNQTISDGFKIDATFSYSLAKKIKLIPALKYYNFHNPNNLYHLKAIEAQMVVAREFNF